MELITDLTRSNEELGIMRAFAADKVVGVSHLLSFVLSFLIRRNYEQNKSTEGISVCQPL